MGVSKAQIRATHKYEKNHYFQKLVAVPKDWEQLIRDRANEKGLSINGYISDLIRSDLGLTKNESESK